MLIMRTFSFYHSSIMNFVKNGVAEKFINSFIDALPNIISAILILVIGWILAKYITKIIMKFIEMSSIDSSAECFFRSLILIVFRILVILISLSQLGVDISTIVTALGAATVTIGLALQDTLGNIASGVLLIFTQPFKEGDYLKIGEDEGTVTKISLFSTYINTSDNKQIVIPNRNITATSVVNYSSNKDRRVDLKFHIAYDNDLLAVKKIIRRILDKEELIDKQKEYVIGVSSQNDRCIVMDVKFWCSNDVYWDLHYKIEEKLNTAFDENNIKLPFQVMISANKQQ